MKDKIEAEFLVIGDRLNHSEITEVLGLEPTELISKGHVKKEAPTTDGAPVLYKESVWALKFELYSQSDIYACIKQILGVLQPKTEAITHLAEKYFCEISVFGFLRDENRLAFNFDRDLIADLSKIHVSLDLDIYPIEDKVLETEQQISDFAKRLMKINTFANNEEEAINIAKALASFEVESSNILEYLSTLTWDQLDDQDVERRIAQLKEHFAKVEHAFHEAKLSSI